ncbi:hypothetical protein N5P37_002251 [Trichoderma harzianum]|nr:hypothetical protein N5P37_002251 [Trichoderma harzianum]
MSKLPIWRAVIQKRRLFERVKRDVGIVVNCTTQYVQNLNHMFRTKANDRRASRVSRNNQEADYQDRKGGLDDVLPARQEFIPGPTRAPAAKLAGHACTWRGGSAQDWSRSFDSRIARSQRQVESPDRGPERHTFMVHYGVSGFTLGRRVGEALVSGAEAGLLIGFNTARAHASRAQRAEAMTRGTS